MVHASFMSHPEAHIGGPLALIRTGDVIEVDVAGQTLNVGISQAEMDARREDWTPPPPKYERGYGWMFLEHIEQADKGCDFDFLKTDSAPRLRNP